MILSNVKVNNVRCIIVQKEKTTYTIISERPLRDDENFNTFHNVYEKINTFHNVSNTVSVNETRNVNIEGFNFGITIKRR